MDFGLPRRQAPVPPLSSSKPSRTQAGGRSNQTGSGKETILVVQRKPTKRMPLLKKVTRDSKACNLARVDGQNGSGNGPTTNESARTRPEAASRRSSGSYQQLQGKSGPQPQSHPVIIRPETKGVKKKAPPPRPPPPKVQSNHTKPTHLPTYDEVVQADLDAFIGEMRGPRRPTAVSSRGTIPVPLVRLNPPAQTSRPTTAAKADANNSFLLIDFDSPSTQNFTGVSSPTTQSKQAQNLLDVFGRDPFSPAPRNNNNNNVTRGSSSLANGDFGNKYNLGPRVLPVGPVATFSLKSTRAGLGSSSGANGLPVWQEDVVLRRGSVPVASSRGDDWLQSCLRDSMNGHGVQSEDVKKFSSSPPPPLPPRPKVSDGSVILDFDGFNGNLMPSPSQSPRFQSPEPPTASPPPVPPFPAPMNGSAFPYDADDTLPPLPPRPKLYDATRPHAVALYDYTATERDDLSFQAGEIITLIHEISGEWLYGLIDDREGLFPKNFVEIVVPLNSSEGDFISEHETTGPRCCAIYDFVGENQDELSFATGEVISLVERVGNDWFRGTLRQNEGLFPISFVEVIEELPTEGFALGISMQDSYIKNSRTSNETVFVALYNFVGEYGELTFNEGDRIVLTGTINDDWLSGILQGTNREGRFPKNFVEQL